MVTMISLLKRAENLSFEEFQAWYDQHAIAATTIPGLRHYYVNSATSPDQVWDAVSMLTFDDEQAMTAGLDSAEGKRSRADTLAHVSRREVLVVNRKEVNLP